MGFLGRFGTEVDFRGGIRAGGKGGGKEGAAFYGVMRTGRGGWKEWRIRARPATGLRSSRSVKGRARPKSPAIDVSRANN